ncbi:MAG: cyclic nucleotide-binding domain-containing protein [Bacteriodetes bacterium]|nr:cyclic nucleotide-binding domain-containing protein [Bacteroidota bacterium]
MEHKWMNMRFIALAVSSAFLAIVLPLKIVFDDFHTLWVDVCIWIVSAVFAADMFFSIRRRKVRGQRVMTQYVKMWLVIDAISIIPVAVFLPHSPLQLIQLLKVIHITSFLQEYTRRKPRNAAFLRLGQFGYIILVAIHWIACAWMSIRPENRADDITRYIKSLYWATTTVATVGYGDITPNTNNEMIFAIGVMLFGVVMYGYLIGNIASLLNNMDPARVHHQENLDRVHAFMRYRNIPHELEQKINEYFNYIWEKRLSYDESSVMAMLPAGLKTEVSLYLKREVIERVSMFRNASDEFIKDIAAHIHPSIVLPGEFVFKAGETARSMYFISRGVVQVISTDNETIATLSDGDFFGEMALLHKRKRNASVRASDFTDLYVLDVATFERIVEEHPDFKLQLEETAEQRSK